MNLTVYSVLQKDEVRLDHNERARRRCTLAKALEEAGDYEGASLSLGDLWRGVGNRPDVEGLQAEIAALVLLRVGSLSGWLGSVGQIAGAQDAAKDIIGEAWRVFDELGDTLMNAEAAGDLAICYWREGAFDEARIHLRQALERLSTYTNTSSDTTEVESHDVTGERKTKTAEEVRAVLLIRSAIVEFTSNRLDESLRLLTEVAPLIVWNSNHVLRGKYHIHLAMTLEKMGTAAKSENAEPHADFMDRALVEYSAAGFHFEQAGHTRYAARVENNLGMLFLALNRFADSHEHLDRAERLFRELDDLGSVAQITDTRARVLLTEGRNREAERAAHEAVEMLADGGEQALIAEAFTTRGVALARCGCVEESRTAFRQAIEVASGAGDNEGAGRAGLSLLEELGAMLEIAERLAIQSEVDQLLSCSTHAETLGRLRKTTREIITKLTVEPGNAMVKLEVEQPAANNGRTGMNLAEALRGSTLAEEIKRYEGELIRQALKASGGSVTHAARILGLTHQSLSFILHTRHQGLSTELKPRKRRQRSIIRMDVKNAKVEMNSSVQ